MSIRSQLEEMRRRCSKLEEENTGLSEVVHHLKKNARKTSIEKAELRMQLEACQEQRNQFKCHLDPLKSDNTRLRSECEELMAGVIMMRIELESMRNQPTYENSFIAAEPTTVKVLIQGKKSSSLPIEKNHSSNTNSIKTQYPDKRDEIEHRKEIDIRAVKNAANAVKRWSEDTFGRRHSAIEYFFDDEILNYRSDEDGNAVMSCFSDCSKSQHHENNQTCHDNNRDIHKDLQDIGLKARQSFKSVMPLLNENSCAKQYIMQRKSYRFSFSNTMHNIQSRLSQDHPNATRIIREMQVYNC
jgi:hypothetical protein